MSSETGGTQNVLAKLKSSIESGNYYEAHQMYRSVYRRYLKQKKYKQARSLVETGALQFYAAGQDGSAVDLSLLLVDLFSQTKEEVSVVSCGVLLQLLFMVPVQHSSRLEFINQVIRWSASVGKVSTGEPALHHEIGEMYRKEKNWDMATKHLILGVHPESAKMLAQIAHESFPNSPESSIGRMVYTALKLLSIGRLEMAEACVKQYLELESEHLNPTEIVKYHGVDLVVYAESPVNFAQYLVLTCKSREPRLFNFLKQRYESGVNNLPDYSDMMNSIGQQYFGIRAQTGGINLNDLMGSLFGGGGGSRQQQLIGNDLD